MSYRDFGFAAVAVGISAASFSVQASAQQRLLCSGEVRDGIYEGYFNGFFDVKNGRLEYSPSNLSSTIHLRPFKVEVAGSEAALNAENAKKLLIHYSPSGEIMLAGFRPKFATVGAAGQSEVEYAAEGARKKLAAQFVPLGSYEKDYPGLRVKVDTKLTPEMVRRNFQLVFKTSGHPWGYFSFRGIGADHYARLVEVGKRRFAGRAFPTSPQEPDMSACSDANSGW